MGETKRGRRGLRLRPLPSGGIPLWLKERLANITHPADGGRPDLAVVASSLLHDRQALRWALSRYKTADHTRCEVVGNPLKIRELLRLEAGFSSVRPVSHMAAQHLKKPIVAAQNVSRVVVGHI